MRPVLLATATLLLASLTFQLGRRFESQAAERELVSDAASAAAVAPAADHPAAPTHSEAVPPAPKAPATRAPIERPDGLWHRKRELSAPAAATESDLDALGYSGAYEASSGLSGALTHLPDEVAPGLTLYSTGHGNSVHLIDSDGSPAHVWRLDYDELFPDPLEFPVAKEHRHFVRRAYPLSNGDLIALFEYIGIARVDRDGRRLWAHPKGYHHDFKIQEDGTIVTLGSSALFVEAAEERYSTTHFKRGIADADVVFLAPDGTETRRFSVMDALYHSDFVAFMGHLPNENADVFHANSIDVIDAAVAAHHPAFDEGDLLVSLRTPGALIAIDPETERVKWLGQGSWRMQHQATALANGNILMMDNRGGNPNAPLRFNRSRALEWNPSEQTIEWQFPPRGVDLQFYTHVLGYVERLGNGNTLITESTQGHLVEVTPSGRIAWEYRSPYRAGENEELVTTLMGARRIAREHLPFLNE
ncbi:Arylsulfotransferase (ASST) [Planctomycetes bacterium Poly30]|uniref:Arylsulfotransferase (ASST) n=1 Tax=Saltatorellus ferox TaxID=2528018 RepID=A0A518EYJ0_9BACT|nr:Arylsulfotransferase (ASST) [Planctomycetes bacterium Poly30]